MQTNRIFESKLCVLEEKKKRKYQLDPQKMKVYGEKEEGANNGS